MSNAHLGDEVDPATVIIEREGDWYVARDETTGVASQGRSRPEALENLAEALALHDEPIPDDIELGEPDVPWF